MIWTTLEPFNGGGLFQLLTLFLFVVCVPFVCMFVGVCACTYPVSLLSHARLRCMCTCNRCTFCLCQNFLNSELLQTVRAKLYAVVLRRSLTNFSYLCWRVGVYHFYVFHVFILKLLFFFCGIIICNTAADPAGCTKGTSSFPLILNRQIRGWWWTLTHPCKNLISSFLYKCTENIRFAQY